MMKIQIRQGVFETNSSSTHSITICTQEQYNDWVAGKCKFDVYNNRWSETVEETPEDRVKGEAIYNNRKLSYYKDWKDLDEKDKQRFIKEAIKERVNCEILGEKYDTKDYPYSNWVSYTEWYNNNDGLEYYSEDFTTPSGDKMTAFGYYGYDG